MGIILEHPMLFKRAKTGKIQSNRILVIHGKTPNTACIIKQTGQLLGKKTEHEEVIIKGKNLGKENETTPVEQALSQAYSDWSKKQDEGYKTLYTLGHPNPSMTVTPAMDVKGEDLEALNAYLQENLADTNTDAEGRLKPMLAYPYKETKHTEFPYYGQPKLDGVRALLVVSATSVVLLSRGGKVYRMPHITKAAAVLQKTLKSKNDIIVLDGELYNHEMEFEDVVSCVKSLKAESALIKFCCYDVGVEAVPFSQRYLLIHTYVTAINSPCVVGVPTRLINNVEGVKKFHLACVEQGYEGAMLRVSEGMYFFGSRSSDLLKVKSFDEKEYIFVKFTADGHRGIRDLKAVCYTEDMQNTFNPTMNGTVAYKEKLYKDWKDGVIKTGDLVTVEHFGCTVNNVPRFPKGKTIRNYE